MLKYLTGYDCVDSGSSPEGSELSDSSNDSRRNAENGGDGSSQILYLSKCRVAYKSFFFTSILLLHTDVHVILCRRCRSTA